MKNIRVRSPSVLRPVVRQKDVVSHRMLSDMWQHCFAKICLSDSDQQIQLPICAEDRRATIYAVPERRPVLRGAAIGRDKECRVQESIYLNRLLL